MLTATVDVDRPARYVKVVVYDYLRSPGLDIDANQIGETSPKPRCCLVPRVTVRYNGVLKPAPARMFSARFPTGTQLE